MLLIIEHRNLVGEALSALLKAHTPDLQIVVLGCADHAASLPYVSIYGVLTSASEKLDRLATAFPEVPLILLEEGRSSNRGSLNEAVQKISIDLPAEAFVLAVLAALQLGQGTRAAPSRMKQTLGAMPGDQSAAAPACLSEREREVHAALRRGLSNKIIANELQLSENTVKIHVRNVIRKLGATNRTMAAMRGAPAAGHHVGLV